MSTSPKRLGIKFNLKREPNMQPADILPIFQRWIQERRVEGMLIDVIDYKHVPDGPAVVLIADEADYAWDLADGQTGLHYVRKRELPGDLASALRLVFRCAMQGALALESEAPDELAFEYRALKINFLDRMTYRNDTAVYHKLQAEISQVMREIYDAEVSLSRHSQDPRRLLAVRVEAQPASIQLDDILSRLSASPEPVQS